MEQARNRKQKEKRKKKKEKKKDKIGYHFDQASTFHI
jgi:hypothetical protein